jgi:hypothetical protein
MRGIMVTLLVKSPTYKKKSSNEGQVMVTLLVEVHFYVTKSSDEGRDSKR